jgi:chemotaxis protein CheZ
MPDTVPNTLVNPLANSPATDPLPARLAAIRARYPASEPEMVVEVVRSVLASMRGDLSSKDVSLLSEVEALGRTISSAKAEIAALRVDDITASHIPFATDELDAIVAHTASATHAILTSCEMLDEVGAECSGEMAAKLTGAITHIYEACSFQDITGQRITKVVATLKAIEEKVASIIAAFGGRADPGDAARVGRATPEVAPSLLNGPQLPTAAMDQSDIDRLLASFD